MLLSAAVAGHPPPPPPYLPTAAAAAPWRAALDRALAANAALRHAIYMQVATVRPDGRPACRTVVFRGFMAGADRPTFVTDSRSRKIADIAAQPWAEIAWYFPESREQFRLQGSLTVVPAGGGSAEQQQVQRRQGCAGAWRGPSHQAVPCTEPPPTTTTAAATRRPEQWPGQPCRTTGASSSRGRRGASRAQPWPPSPRRRRRRMARPLTPSALCTWTWTRWTMCCCAATSAWSTGGRAAAAAATGAWQASTPDAPLCCRDAPGTQ